MEEYRIMEYLELTVTIDAGGGRETENLFGVALLSGFLSTGTNSRNALRRN